jgi:ribosomal protein L11 methylase PrmA
MDFSAFSHGQIQSKQWLCEILEPYIPYGSNILILGCWYNILGLMLLSRNPITHYFVRGIDIDPNAIEIANKICQAWMIEPNVKLSNSVNDANTFDYFGHNVVINCSLEHMSSDDWFTRIPNGTLVCLQSSNVNITDPSWDIKNHINSMSMLTEKYPLSYYLFRNTKNFDYGTFSYERFMCIGLK